MNKSDHLWWFVGQNHQRCRKNIESLRNIKRDWLESGVDDDF